jgi:hypothetical protein
MFVTQLVKGRRKLNSKLDILKDTIPTMPAVEADIVGDVAGGLLCSQSCSVSCNETCGTTKIG